MPLRQFHNILVVRTDRIGDVVLTTPVFKALRQAYPAARITAMLAPQTIELVEGNPYIDQIFVDDKSGAHKGFFGILQLARSIRLQKYDAVIIYHTKRRYNWLMFLAGIPVRIGYKNDKFGFLLTHPQKDERHLGLKHEAHYCLDLLKVIGVEHAAADLFIPKRPADELWADQWLLENDIKPGGIIAIHAGASDETKMWPKEMFARLIYSLHLRYALKVVLIGHGATGAVAAQIKNAARVPVFDLSGQLSLGQTAALLRRCRLMISNDSGPVHIGAGVGIPVLSLFLRNQPGINPVRWAPLGAKSFVLCNKPGEEINLDSGGKVVCGKADSIAVQDVLDVVDQILAKDEQKQFYW